MPAKRPRGKPRETPGEVLTHQVAVRLTDQEHRDFCQMAVSQHLTPARMARELIRAELSRRKQIPS